jgi:SpoVK/Ycf46/Vps4 family AAA+-type ATPase
MEDDGTYQIKVWKAHKGLELLQGIEEEDNIQKPRTFQDALQKIIEPIDNEPLGKSKVIYIFFNPKPYFSILNNNPAVYATMQLFREVAYQSTRIGSYIIMIGGQFDIPSEIADMVTVLDFSFPDYDIIRKTYGEFIKNINGFEHLKGEQSKKIIDSAATAAVGMSTTQAENALCLSLVKHNTIDVRGITEEKRNTIRQSGILEYIEEEDISLLGGFSRLKEHVTKRKEYYKDIEAAKKYGLNPPKGILIVGIPGTGKSLSAKAIAGELELPLYRFNLSQVFKSLVGASEAAIRKSLRMAEALAPCVLQFDEFEKALAGGQSSGQADSGVTSRVIGEVLTWMQETTKPIYKVATANTLGNLDSAILRRGRWDCVFSVGMPSRRERAEIFSIHLKKRNRNPKEYKGQDLLAATEGFVGAEIESAIEEAMYTCYPDELTTEAIVDSCNQLIPISVTDNEAIADFLSWVTNRATPVGDEQQKKQQKQSVAAPQAKKRMLHIDK